LIKTTTAKRIKKKRLAEGLSQHELERKLGLTYGIVSKWEIGYREPKRWTVPGSKILEWLKGK